MSCPYLANPLKPAEPPDGPSMNNVCFAYGAQFAYWSYTTVNVHAQDMMCCTGKTHKQCQRFQMAQSKGLVPPVVQPVAKKWGWLPF